MCRVEAFFFHFQNTRVALPQKKPGAAGRTDLYCRSLSQKSNSSLKSDPCLLPIDIHRLTLPAIRKRYSGMLKATGPRSVRGSGDWGHGTGIRSL